MIEKASFPNPIGDPLEEAAECLKTLGHPVRLRMIELLLEREYSVGELAMACYIPSHMASEHLRMMKMCGFLGSQRDGRKTYYYVIQPHLNELMNCVKKRFRGDEAEKISRVQGLGGNHG